MTDHHPRPAIGLLAALVLVYSVQGGHLDLPIDTPAPPPLNSSTTFASGARPSLQVGTVWASGAVSPMGVLSLLPAPGPQAPA